MYPSVTDSLEARPVPGSLAQRLRGKRQQCFLRGPVPWPWLERAARLPGKALQVALALRYRAGIERAETITLSPGLLAGMGVDRFAKARALGALEVAGLIAVERRPGRSPTVTIIDLPDRAAGAS